MLTDTLRVVAETLGTPVNAVLLLLMAATVFLFGSLVAELFTERVRLKAKLPALADRLRSGEDIKEIIESSGLLKRQKAALLEITNHPTLSPDDREALAVRLVFGEREHYDGIVRISDIIARLGPMFGLLGTLIPLGPGLIALGRGDTFTLSQSLLTAFDTTIAGIAAAAIAFVISAIRKKWYGNYMASLEMIMHLTVDSEQLKIKSEADDETEI
jgi:biopolymer transport protein ExbB/TolQ